MAGLDPVAAEELVRQRLDESIESLRALRDPAHVAVVAAAAHAIVDSLDRGGKVLFCGNGGSSMDAGHLAAELLGRFKRDRPPLPVMSLADSTAALTAIANDYGYEHVFARMTRGLGCPGDVLVCLTTSGNSTNVIRALESARDIGMTTILLTGSDGGMAADLSEVCIKAASTDTARVQEACLHLGHTICEMVEAAMWAGGSN